MSEEMFFVEAVLAIDNSLEYSRVEPTDGKGWHWTGDDSDFCGELPDIRKFANRVIASHDIQKVRIVGKESDIVYLELGKKSEVLVNRLDSLPIDISLSAMRGNVFEPLSEYSGNLQKVENFLRAVKDTLPTDTAKETKEYDMYAMAVILLGEASRGMNRVSNYLKSQVGCDDVKVEDLKDER